MISIEYNNILKYKIDTMDNIIIAKNKGKKIIDSCENDKQLDSAKKYVKLYGKATKDLVGESELEILILSKRMSL